MTLASAGIAANSDSSVAHLATGSYTGDSSGTPVEVKLGFLPKYVELIDMAASTGSKRYVWILGMASTISALDTGLAALAEDSNTAIDVPWMTVTGQTPGIYAPGTSGPGDGTLINANPTYLAPDHSKSYSMKFNINVNTHTYVWAAFG